MMNDRTDVPIASLVNSATDARFTDIGNAERFVRLHGARFRFVKELGEWLHWDGKRWRRDLVNAEIEAAKHVSRELFARAASLAAAASTGDEAAGARADEYTKWARKSSSRSAIAALVALAESDPKIATTADAFDRDPFLLNVVNGTIDLRSGELRSHRQADMITKLAAAVYAPTARCPRFAAFLANILPDEHTRSWVQRLLGYALTGSVVEQVLAFFYGAGANGKSVLVDVLLAIFGDYGLRAAPDLVLLKHGEAHPTEQADLHGRRLVVCSEIEHGRAWAESTLKRLTGDTTIRARRMRQDFFTFDATHKLVVVANAKPRVEGTDHAIWRRLKLLPFDVTIAEHNRDRGLTTKLLDEREGILAWLVAGCLAWQREGLGEAPAVVAATLDYRAEQDIVGRWITERCTLGDREWSKKSTLYADHTAWCRESGTDALTRDELCSRLVSRGVGVRVADRGVGRGLAGIALAAASEQRQETDAPRGDAR